MRAVTWDIGTEQDITLETASARAIAWLLSPDLVTATIKRQAQRITLRPVEIKGDRLLQLSTYDGKKTFVKNVPTEDAPQQIQELLAEPFTSLSAIHPETEWSIQVSRKGRPILHEHRRKSLAVPTLAHDRTIPRPFPEGEPNPMLQAIGLMTADGKVKADRRRKFVQINEFIRIAGETADLRQVGDEPLLIVDFGCGNAYLSFALHHFLTHKMGVKAELIGVDWNAELIERNRQIAEALNEPTIRFEAGGIDKFRAPRPADIVTALHACDTATDAALAKALEYQAKLIFAAPCCHHYVQSQPGFLQASGAHELILRDGILRERLGDLLTDTLRAQLLRIAGYQVNVIEFTAPEHTAKNLLLQAVRLPGGNQAELANAYGQLRDTYGAAPLLESLLPSELKPMIGGAP